MPTYALTLSPEYVSDWVFSDAIREINQNGIDQYVEDSKNLHTCVLDRDNGTISITSKSSYLDKSSLLLGKSTKPTNKTIGKYGEGYKLALLVLTRLGHNVKIMNYGKKEVWTPKIVKSRVFECDILHIDVKKWYIKSVPSSDLTFLIEGVTKEEFDSVVDTYLPLQSYDCLRTDMGEVLTDDRLSGKIFVSGLYVCDYPNSELAYGYNFKPEHISLDRDRKLVNTFEIEWTTSNLWSNSRYEDIAVSLVIREVPDVKHIDSSMSNDNIVNIANKVFDSIQSKHGVNALPVESEDAAEFITNKYKGLRPVVYPLLTKVVKSYSSNYKDILSVGFKEDNRITVRVCDATTDQLVQELYTRHGKGTCPICNTIHKPYLQSVKNLV